MRLYIEVKKGSKKSDECLKNIGYLSHCKHCLYREENKGLATSTPDICPECGEKLIQAGPLWLGEIQNENEATFTKKIKPEDQIINFDNDAKAIVHQIQALSSVPGAYFVYKNTKFKVLKAKYSASEAEKSGKILEFIPY